MVNLFEINPDFTCNHDMRRCVVNGEQMFCTKERIQKNDLPNGLYMAEVRRADNLDKWATIEPSVAVNHCATLVKDTPFDFSETYNVVNSIYPYIQINSYEIERDPILDADDYGDKDLE